MHTRLLATIVFVSCASNAFAVDNCKESGLASGKNGWCVPQIRFTDDLAKIFTIDDCEAVSGLMCRIQYNGKLPLPSEVHFVELAADGNALGNPIRLIYPKLKSGALGVASFRIKHMAKTIELRAKWDGPWRDPF